MGEATSLATRRLSVRGAPGGEGEPRAAAAPTAGDAPGACVGDAGRDEAGEAGSGDAGDVASS